MARTVDEGFQEFLTRLVPTQAQRTAGASHRASVKGALEAHLTVNRFFETGSFSHGTGVRHHSDIDVLVSLGHDKPSSSYTALTWVKDALEKRFPLTTVQIRRPAVQVLFGGGYETWEVIPGFLTGRGGSAPVYDIPSAVTGGGWIDAAPKEHLDYVNECNKEPQDGDAKALARLIKAWKYYCDVPISSFYLEMRAAHHVKGVSAYIHVWDLCLLLEKLRDHQLADMNDPKGASGRFSATSSDSTREDAISKVRTAAARARKALDAYRADDPSAAFYYLDLLFGGKFPAR
jgi:predicted nucleotidyltransferase